MRPPFLMTADRTQVRQTPRGIQAVCRGRGIAPRGGASGGSVLPEVRDYLMPLALRNGPYFLSLPWI